MKVLIITEKFPNTLQPWLANLCAQIVKNGWEVEIVTMSPGDDEYPKIIDDYGLRNKVTLLDIGGYKSVIAAIRNIFNKRLFRLIISGLLRRGFSPNKNDSLLRKSLSYLVLLPFLERDDIDVVHSHFEVVGYQTLPISKSNKVPLVVTFHGLVPPGVPSLSREKRLEYIDSAKIILLNTEFAKKQYVNLGADPYKVRIVPQGTDLSRYKYNPKEYCPKEKLRILSVGRLSSDKGHRYAIEAARKLVEKGISLEFRIIGKGPELSILQEYINELELSSNVFIEVGLSEEELIKRYAGCHIFILASLKDNEGYHEETQGVVIQEAQASGALVVCTDVGGIPECVVDGENAFLVKERSAESIARKVEWILQNHHQWGKWQLSARKHVEKYYDINAVGKTISRVYSQVIRQDNGKGID